MTISEAMEQLESLKLDIEWNGLPIPQGPSQDKMKTPLIFQNVLDALDFAIGFVNANAGDLENPTFKDEMVI